MNEIKEKEMDIKTIIIAEKYTFDDYVSAINESDDFDINQTSYGNTSLLQEAIKAEKYDIAMDLVRRKIDLNHQDRYGHTALHYLCAKPKCIELVEMILKAGANPNIKNENNMTPIYSMTANTNGNYKDTGVKYEMMELLLKYGADINIDRDGKKPVDVAKTIEDKKALEILEKYE